MTKRAAILTRVSSEDQAKEGTSLGTQRERCLTFVTDQGWEVVHDLAAPNGPRDVFEDAGVSGAKASRPALDRLLALVRSGKVDVLVVTKWDRLGRSLNNLTSLWEELKAAGVEAISLSEPETSGSKGELMRNIMASIAQEERRVIRERTTLGRVARLRGGGWSGGEPPLGFRVEGQGAAARLVLHEPEAAMIRRAVSLLLDSGMTTGEAATVLNAENLLPRKAPRWTAALLRNHLMRGPWAGTWTYAKPSQRRAGKDLIPEPVTVTIPAMLTPERHQALLAYLAQTRSAKVQTCIHPLSTLATGPCGHTYSGAMKRDRGNRRYRCRHSKDQSAGWRCASPTVLADVLDDMVWAAIVRRIRDPLLLIAEAEERLGLRGSAEASVDSLAAAQQRVTEAEQGLAALLTAALRDGWDSGVVAQAKRDLEVGLTKARGDVATLTAMRQETAQAVQQRKSMDLAASFADLLDNADAELRAGILRELQVQVTVGEVGPSGQPMDVTMTGVIDHDLLAATLAPAEAGVLSLEKRTSR